MFDGLFVLMTIAFFALMAAYTKGCARLGAERLAADEENTEP